MGFIQMSYNFLICTGRYCYTKRTRFLFWFSPPGGWFHIKMISYQYSKSYCGDKMILWLSYIHNGVSYTIKMTSLYQIMAQGEMLFHLSFVMSYMLCMWGIACCKCQIHQWLFCSMLTFYKTSHINLIKPGNFSSSVQGTNHGMCKSLKKFGGF